MIKAIHPHAVDLMDGDIYSRFHGIPGVNIADGNYMAVNLINKTGKIQR